MVLPVCILLCIYTCRLADLVTGTIFTLINIKVTFKQVTNHPKSYPVEICSVWGTVYDYWLVRLYWKVGIVWPMNDPNRMWNHKGHIPNSLPKRCTTIAPVTIPGRRFECHAGASCLSHVVCSVDQRHHRFYVILSGFSKLHCPTHTQIFRNTNWAVFEIKWLEQLMTLIFYILGNFN